MSPRVQECVVTETSTQICTDCTEQDFVQAIPAHIAVQAIIGWNAGANSVAQLSGDVHGVWRSPVNTAGATVGLAAVPRTDVTRPESIDYGIYVFTVNSITFAQPIMAGRLVGSPQQLFGSVPLEVRRAAGVVQFLIDGDVVFTTAARDSGLTLLGCALYASGDIVQ